MATIKDIAKAAGVSQGTVSNVLNGKDNVSSDKIKRVMQVVEELGYSINEKAQNLRKGAAKVLAAVIPNLYDKTYVDFFSNFKKYAESKGYIVDLYITNDDPDYEKEQIQRIRSRMTEGVAVFTSIAEGSKAYYEAGFSNEDVIFISGKQAYPCKFIGYDSKKAGKDVARKVLKKGYKKIALLTGSLNSSGTKEFYDYFMEEVKAAKDAPEIYGLSSIEQYRYQSAVRIFTHMQPEVVVTDSMYMAQVIHDVQQNFYKHIPVDIYSLAPVYAFPENNIIKYEVDYRNIGKKAASYLIKRNWNGKNEIIIKSKGFSDWPGVRVKTSKKVLNVLSIGSPTTRALKTVVNLYKFNTGITVQITELHSEGMYELMKSWGPELSYDIVRMDKDWFPWLAKSVCEPITNIEPNIINKLSGYLPNALENYAYLNGEIYALPGTPSVQLLFYRKDLFENIGLKRLYYEKYKQALEVPKTFEEYNRIARFFTKKFNKESPTKYGSTFVFGEPGLIGTEYLIRYFSHSKDLFDEQGNIFFDTDTAKKALEETKEAWDCSSKEKHLWWTDAAKEFAKGDTAMSIHMINHVSGFIGEDSNIRGKVGWSMVPGNNPLLGGSVLGISKYSRNKKEALDFLKWLSRDDIGTATVLLGGMSAKKAAYEDKEVNDSYPWLNYAKNCFGSSKIRYYPTAAEENIELKELQNILGVALREGIMGNMDMDNVLKFSKSSYERMKRSNKK